MIKILGKPRVKPDFGIVLTPDEQNALERALERVKSLREKNHLTGKELVVGCPESIIISWTFYLQTLELEAAYKAKRGPINELQRRALTRRKFILSLKKDLKRAPRAEDLITLLNLSAEDSEILRSLVTNDIALVQQTIRPHLSFDEKWENRRRKERNAKQRAHYRDKKKAARKKVQS